MKIHIVQKGDTLFEIAKNYDVNYEDIVKLNPQLSSPDMIMPGMKIKIPGASKQIKSKTDKAVRVEPSESTQREAKTTERPMGKEEGDDRIEKKDLQVKVPETYEPLYPVKPIEQMPSTMPKEKEVPIKKKKQVQVTEPVEQVEEKMEVQEEMLPQTPYRPMGESECHNEPPIVHYCCECGRPLDMFGQMNKRQWYPSPWHQKGTYFTGNPFMSPRMNCRQNNGMHFGPQNRVSPNMMHGMNQGLTNQMNHMPHENMFRGYNSEY